MPSAELRWAPHPYRGGFCITDDTDAADLESVRIVYDFMDSLGLRATKTVWVFPPEEPSGIPALPTSITRGVTLADPAYLNYCRTLASRGVEIALHGATAGNNRRELIQRAFAVMDANFPPASTYICHAKNADNPYWQEKVVARGPLALALRLYARGHHCSGEDPASPYFWGDLCRQRLRYIRLLRTRRINTLAANPSMPYFEREKPLVPGWFSATKRSFREATSVEALDDLEREWGVCVLYQYRCRHVDNSTGRVLAAFAAGAERLAARKRVWMDTATRLLDRLRLMQGVFLASRANELVLVNTNDEVLEGVQIDAKARLSAPSKDVRAADGVVVIQRLAPGELRRLSFAEPLRAVGRTALAVGRDGTGRTDFGHGHFLLNVGERSWEAEPGVWVAPGSFALRFAPGLEQLQPRSRASDTELTRLFVEQSAIIAREVLFKGRPFDTNRLLTDETVMLGNQDNW
jgi:hypothetical protein